MSPSVGSAADRPTGEPVAEDALEFITEDHADFREMLDRYEELGDDETIEKRELVDQLIGRVVQHSVMEEQVFYPYVREHLPELEDDVREEIEEHHVIEVLLAELQGMDAGDEQFDAKMEVLAENLLHHLEEEEEELFPQLREDLSQDQLRGLLEPLQEAKNAAPTDPDPQRVGG